MKYENLTKDELISELKELRLKVHEFEKQKVEPGAVGGTKRDGEGKFEIIFNSVEDAIFVLGFNDDGMPGNFIEVNEIAVERYGYTREELLKMSPAELNDPEAFPTLPETVGVLKTEGHNFFEIIHIKKDGTKFPVEVNARLIDYEGRTLVISIVRDITERKLTEEVLNETEEMYHLVTDTMENSVWLMDMNFVTIYFNPSVTHMRGYTLEELKKMPMEKNMTPESLKIAMKRISEEMTPERLAQKDLDISATLDLEFYRKDGSTNWYEVRVSVIRDDNGNPCKILGVSRDISKRREVEEALKESEEKFRNFFNSVNDAVFVYPIDEEIFFGKYIEVNDVACERLGYTREELMNMSVRDISVPEALEEFQPVMEKFSPEREPSFDWIHKTKDGREIPVEISSHIFDLKGKPTVIAIARDITERKKAEEVLKESEEKFRSFVENANDIVYSLTLDGIFSYVSPNWTEILGHDLSEVVGKHFVPFVHPDDVPLCQDFLKKVIATGEKQSGVVYRVKHKDGDFRWHTSNSSPIIDNEGKVVSCLGIAHDITDRKRAEKELRDSVERMDLALKGADLGLWDWNFVTGKVVRDKRWAEMLGYTIDEIDSEDLSFDNLVLVHPDDKDMVLKAWLDHFEGRTPFYEIEHRVRHKSGGWIWILVRGRVFESDIDGNPIRVAGTQMDITDRKEAEEALRIRDAAMHSTISSIVLTEPRPKAKVTYVNPSTLKMWGYDDEKDVIGRSIFDFWQDEDEVQEVVNALIEKGSWNGEMVAVKKDGSSFDAQVWTNVVLDDYGKPISIIASIIDITERKKAEEAQKESEERLDLALKGADLGLWDCDLKTGTFNTNERFSEVVGYNKEEIENNLLWWEDHIHPDDKEKVLEKFVAHFKGHTPYYSIEQRLQSKSGGYKWISVRGRIVEYDNDGNPVRMAGITRDITEKREAQEALKLRLEYEEAIAFSSEELVSSNRLETSLERVLERTRTVIDVSRGSIWENFEHPTNGPSARLISRVKAPGISFIIKDTESEHRAYKDFSVSYPYPESKSYGGVVRDFPSPDREFIQSLDILSVLVLPIYIESRFWGFICFEDCLTEREWKKEEVKLLETMTTMIGGAIERNKAIEELKMVSSDWQETFDAMDDMVAIIDSEFKISRANKAMKEAFGDDIIGEQCYKLFHGTDESIPLCPSCYTFETGEAGYLELNEEHLDNRWFDVFTYPVLDNDNNATKVVHIVRDITERKRTERELEGYAEELEKANKEVRDFSNIVSHDLRAPLINIKGYTNELNQAMNEVYLTIAPMLGQLGRQEGEKLSTLMGEEVPTYIDFINSSVSRMGNLINAILTLSRMGKRELDFSEIDMDEVVQSSLKDLAHRIKEMGIKTDVGKLPVVVADRTSMIQVMQNILTNAVTYLDPERQGEIEVRAERGDEETTFYIRDSGLGIYEKDIDRIFNLFQRAGREDVPGEGMGLTYVKTLVERHGGKIWCESRPGEGTTFTFTIPNKIDKDR